MIRITDGGIASTVQDLGRFGNYHIGMPPSGAMDEYARSRTTSSGTTRTPRRSR